MSKQIDNLKKIKVKQGLLQGKSKKRAVKDAGYSLATAINAWRLTVVKCCEEEIAREFKLADLTPEKVLKDIALAKELALRSNSISDYIRTCELEGKYLAMFTDKSEVNNKNPDKIIIAYGNKPINSDNTQSVENPNLEGVDNK